jgi:hypothetical protein
MTYQSVAFDIYSILCVWRNWRKCTVSLSIVYANCESVEERTYDLARPLPIRLFTTASIVPLTAESYANFGCLLVTI